MNADAIVAAKVQTRRRVAQSLVDLQPNRRRAAGIAVAQRLMDLPVIREARTLMAFLSLPTEIDTWPTIQRAWRAGKRVAVPRLEPLPEGRDGPFWRRVMVAVILPPADIEGVSAHPRVRPGPLGILEVSEGPPLDPAEIDVVLVPCQAVDRQGRRLGKGGGFYDRFLARPGLRAERIALAFQEQVLDEVPWTNGDCRVTMVVTDSEVLTVEAQKHRPSARAGGDQERNRKS
jgi:5-formyltetrahydrofolate cyclo-ligase